MKRTMPAVIRAPLLAGDSIPNIANTTKQNTAILKATLYHITVTTASKSAILLFSKMDALYQPSTRLGVSLTHALTDDDEDHAEYLDARA